jgi:predicted Zn-dependent protease
MQKAVDQMETAAKISVDFPGVLDYLGGLYHEVNDLPRGERFVQQLMQHEGRTAYLTRYLADMQAEGGDYDEAVATYKEAIRLDPDLRDGYWNLFLTLWEQGGAKRQEGLNVLDTWLKRRPDDSEVRRYRDAFHDSLAKQG